MKTLIAIALLFAVSASSQTKPDTPTAQGVYVKTSSGAWKIIDKAPIAQIGSKGGLGAAFSGGISSVKAVCKLKGATSANVMEVGHPVFYVVDLQAFYSARDFVIVRMEPKKDRREQQYAAARLGSAKIAYRPEDVTDVKTEKISDTVFTVEPVSDIAPGEYILAFATGCAGYDFTVTTKESK